MKRSDVQAKQAEGLLFDTYLMANPAATQEGIIFFKKGAGRGFFLVDENDDVLSFSLLDDAVAELRSLGVKRVELHI